MARETINKSFIVKPFAASNRDSEVIDLEESLSRLAATVRLISDAVYLTTESDDYNAYLEAVLSEEYTLADGTVKKLPSQPHVVGRILGSRIPAEAAELLTSNISRHTELYNNLLFQSISSHAARIKRSQGEGYTSAGYKRTLNTNRGKVYPKISYSSVDRQLTKIEVAGDTILWSVRVDGEWIIFYFPFDKKRFAGASKVSLPDVQLDDQGGLEFRFTAVYEYVSSEISSDYVIGVDVGITEYVTASVTNSYGEVIETTTLSGRFKRLYAKYLRMLSTSRDLADKVKSPERRVSQNPLRLSRRVSEYENLRSAIKRIRKEMAILAAQELADLSWRYGNAVIVFEDLTWRKNTMQNGRWNIGELMKWTKHYQHLNGSRMSKTSAAYTSQTCSDCGAKGGRFSKRTFVCNSCDSRLDRDVNASINIARRGYKTARKMSDTRRVTIAKAGPGGIRKVRRTPKMRETLGYQGQRRSQEVKTLGITRSKTSSTVRVNGAERAEYAASSRDYDRNTAPRKKDDYSIDRCCIS